MFYFKRFEIHPEIRIFAGNLEQIPFPIKPIKPMTKLLNLIDKIDWSVVKL